MERGSKTQQTVFSIFGAAGDLTWRKLTPALYRLFTDGWLPEEFRIIGLDTRDFSVDEFRKHLREGVEQFQDDPVSDQDWSNFSKKISFLQGDFTSSDLYQELGGELDRIAHELGARPVFVFYLAVPPTLVEEMVRQLANAKLNQDRERSRIVIEKPFGRDLDSATHLNQVLTRYFHESQIYRIDHYLGKETVQNILAFRFGNAMFEPIYNRHYIDHVQITVAESLGVGHRGGYYDNAGALRDMIQNHLMQILCLVAMEAPISFDETEVRNKKVDVLKAIRPIPKEAVNEYAVRGQYASGRIDGDTVAGYREEENVAPDSRTETFAALKLMIDNWRWQDVPFFLRTGKRLPARVSEVSIQFREIPHRAFPSSVQMESSPNRLLLSIQPEEGIFLRFEVKHPGLKMHLSPVQMEFYYRDAFQEKPHEAYETLLVDVMLGDATLFMRADQMEAAWSVMAPILESWNRVEPYEFPNYSAGTWGPEDADMLIAREGKKWALPTYLRPHNRTASCRIIPG